MTALIPGRFPLQVANQAAAPYARAQTAIKTIAFGARVAPAGRPEVTGQPALVLPRIVGPAVLPVRHAVAIAVAVKLVRDAIAVVVAATTKAGVAIAVRVRRRGADVSVASGVAISAVSVRSSTVAVPCMSSFMCCCFVLCLR